MVHIVHSMCRDHCIFKRGIQSKTISVRSLHIPNPICRNLKLRYCLSPGQRSLGIISRPHYTSKMSDGGLDYCFRDGHFPSLCRYLTHSIRLCYSLGNIFGIHRISRAHDVGTVLRQKFIWIDPGIVRAAPNSGIRARPRPRSTHTGCDR